MTTDPKPLDAVLALTAEVERLRAERDALSHQLEADRTTVTDAVARLRKELDSRHWLTEGRGSYEWDDDRYREEFFLAGRALIAAMEPLGKLAANFAGCPKTSAEVAKARIDKDAEIERLKAVNEDADTIRKALVDYGRLIGENEQLRAQGARLAEALRAEIHCQTCDGTGIMGDRCEDCAYRGYRRNDCGCCGGAGKWEAKCAECNGTKQSNRSPLSIAALDSTDARKWMREQIALRLERLVAEMKRDRTTLPEQHKWGWDCAVTYVEDAVAELRRKEGE